MVLDIVLRCSKKEGVFMRRVFVAIFATWLFAVLAPTQTAHAQDVTVCPPGGDAASCRSYGKIQDAIDNAAPNSVISIPEGVRTEEGIDIVNKDVTIRGAHPQKTIVQAATSPCGLSERVFTISGARVKIQDLTIQNGCIHGAGALAAGGGIWNSGFLTLQRVVVRDNSVIRSDSTVVTETFPISWAPMGGAIYNVGSLVIDSSTIISNEVRSTANNATGGGIYNNGGAYIVNSTISENKAIGSGTIGGPVFGGGIYNAGTLSMEYSTVVKNAAISAGSGLYSQGEVELVNNLFFANSSLGREVECPLPVARSRATEVMQLTDPDCELPVLATMDLGQLITDTPVPVYVPEEGSDSIDFGICTLSRVNADQRGSPRSQGRECDLGSTERGITFAPLIVSALPMPDLIVRAVTIEPGGLLDSSTQATVKVVIENIGNKASMDRFYIDLFINPRQAPPNHGGTTWTDLCRSDKCRSDEGIVWLAPPTIYPSERFTFTSDIDIDPYAVRASSRWDKYFSAGTVELWVIVDSFEENRSPEGYISERREDNNRYQVPAFTVAPGRVPITTSGTAQPDGDVMVPPKP
jgi:hypothetical protein